MKSIEEAAKERANKPIIVNEGYKLSNYISFQVGAAFAQEWISIEGELPEDGDIVLVKSDLNCFSTAYFHGEKSGFITFGEDAYEAFGDVKFWRPIERK